MTSAISPARNGHARMISTRDNLKEFLDTSSLRVEPEPTIRLASGIMSRYYVDCKKALSYPEARQWIGELVVEMLGEQIESIQGVGGLELGAVPVSIAVSDVIYQRTGKRVPTFIVRKQSKEHGTRRIIEGPLQAGDHVLVVDDVITTGDSTRQAILKCREAGLVVERAIAIIDRLEGRNEPVIADGIKLESLITLQELPSYRG